MAEPKDCPCCGHSISNISGPRIKHKGIGEAYIECGYCGLRTMLAFGKTDSEATTVALYLWDRRDG